MKNNKLYVKANSFQDDIPLFILFKALEIESE